MQLIEEFDFGQCFQRLRVHDGRTKTWRQEQDAEGLYPETQAGDQRQAWACPFITPEHIRPSNITVTHIQHNEGLVRFHAGFPVDVLKFPETIYVYLCGQANTTKASCWGIMVPWRWKKQPCLVLWEVWELIQSPWV